MPNRSGKWSLPAQMQAYGNQKWTQPPVAPTIGTATAGSSLCAAVTFTAPSFLGNPAASGCSAYQVVSSPGCITASGGSSPITVSSLVDGTSYTFSVKAQNAIGFGASSAASNSITVAGPGQQAYTTAGSYCWTAPSGVTKVSIVAVGGGGGGKGGSNMYGAGGGGLGYKNNLTVSPGSSYAVVVGSGGPSSYNGCIGQGGNSSITVSGTAYTAFGGGPSAGSRSNMDGGGNGGGGCGGGSSFGIAGGGGAGGYAGNGGGGSYSTVNAGSGGAGASGQNGGSNSNNATGGGGVGLLGQGCSGSSGGQGGSGGCTSTDEDGAVYGGGGSGAYSQNGGCGGVGAVRIIWPGNTRSFPSTCTGNL